MVKSRKVYQERARKESLTESINKTTGGLENPKYIHPVSGAMM
jgi:hypothetical protein